MQCSRRALFLTIFWLRVMIWVYEMFSFVSCFISLLLTIKFTVTNVRKKQKQTNLIKMLPSPKTTWPSVAGVQNDVTLTSSNGECVLCIRLDGGSLTSCEPGRRVKAMCVDTYEAFTLSAMRQGCFVGSLKGATTVVFSSDSFVLSKGCDSDVTMGTVEVSDSGVYSGC